SGDVVLPREPEKVRRENALRVVGGAVAVGKMDSVLCPPFLPLFEHVHHVAAVLMQSQEKPTKRSHAAQQEVAQLLEEFAFEVWHGNSVKAGKNFRMLGNH